MKKISTKYSKFISIGALVLLICIFLIPILLRRFENEPVISASSNSYSSYDRFYSEELKEFRSNPTDIKEIANSDLKVESVLCEENIIDICYKLKSKNESLFPSEYPAKMRLVLEDGTKYFLSISNFATENNGDDSYYIAVCEDPKEILGNLSNQAGKKAALTLYTLNNKKKAEFNFQFPEKLYEKNRISVNKKYTLTNGKALMVKQVTQHAIYSSIEYSCDKLKESQGYILDVFDEKGNKYICLGGEASENQLNSEQSSHILNYEPFTGEIIFFRTYFHDASSEKITEPEYLNSSEEIKLK